MLTRVEVYDTQDLDGDFLELPLDADVNQANIQIRDITGLGPVKTDILTDQHGNTDGESYMGGNTGKRNIILTVGYNPDYQVETINELRLMLYKYFMVKKQVLMRFFNTSLDPVEIYGYVESFEPNIFSKDPEIQISVICPLPDFVSVDSIVRTGLTTDTGEIPESDVPTFVIDYQGNVPAGFDLWFEVNDDVEDYDDFFYILNYAYGLYALTFNALLTAGTRAHVSTHAGMKFIRREYAVGYTLHSSLLASASILTDEWLTLEPGENGIKIITMPAGVGLTWRLEYYERFGAI